MSLLNPKNFNLSIKPEKNKVEDLVKDEVQEINKEEIFTLKKPADETDSEGTKSGFCSNDSCYNQKTTKRKFRKQISYFCDVSLLIKSIFFFLVQKKILIYFKTIFF